MEYSGEVEDMSCQYMMLWHVKYFALKALEKQQRQ